MRNRIPDSPPTPGQEGQPSQPASQELRNLARTQIARRMHQVRTYVQEHPLTGIGAAFGMGILLGWIIKRK